MSHEGEHQDGSSGVDADLHENARPDGPSPIVLAQLACAWAALADLKEQRAADSHVLDRIYADRSVTKELCRRAVFVPLVVKPHACDSVILHANALGQACSNDGPALQQFCSQMGNSVAYGGSENEDHGSGCLVDGPGGASDGPVHGFCQVDELLSAYDAYGVPVAEVHFGNYEQTLDMLHDHVLCCIEESQMQQTEAG